MARLAAAQEIERLLAKGKLFQVDSINCMKHANIVRAFRRHEEKTPWSAKPKHEQLAFKVAFIAVCHQFNWDYLQQKMFELLLVQEADIAKSLRTLKSNHIEILLAGYPDKARIRAKERARLLRNVGTVLTEQYGGDLRALYRDCESARLGDGSFHALLDRFEAYRLDPLKKKTNVLSHDLYSEKILQFKDPQEMEPAIDYHIMRVYLRTGRVIFMSDGVGSYLKGSPNPRGALVRALRECVSEAVKLTAQYAGLSVADLNFVEWQVGRSVCTNLAPKCESRNFSKPLAADVDVLCEGGCLYRTVCVANSELAAFLQLEEPKYVSSAY